MADQGRFSRWYYNMTALSITPSSYNAAYASRTAAEPETWVANRRLLTRSFCSTLLCCYLHSHSIVLFVEYSMTKRKLGENETTALSRSLMHRTHSHTTMLRLLYAAFRRNSELTRYSCVMTPWNMLREPAVLRLPMQKLLVASASVTS